MGSSRGVTMDQFYFEEGYIEQGYFATVVDSGAINFSVSASFTAELNLANTTGYYIEDYIETGYFVSAVIEAEAALSVSITQLAESLRIKQLEADFEALFSPSIQINATRAGEFDLYAFYDFDATANRTRDNDSLLEYFASLNIQAARTADFESNILSQFDSQITAARTRQTEASVAVSFDQTVEAGKIVQFGAELGALFTPNVLAVASLNGSIDLLANSTLVTTGSRIQQLESNLTEQFNITANGGRLEEIDADFVSEFDTEIFAIEYRPNTLPFNRPFTQFKTWKVFQQTNPVVATIRTEDPSIEAYDNNRFNLIGFVVNAFPYLEVTHPTVVNFNNNNFYISFKYNFGDADINRYNDATIFRLGTSFPVFFQDSSGNFVGSTGGSTTDAIEVFLRRTGDFTQPKVCLNINGITIVSTDSYSGSGTYRIIRDGNTVSFFYGSILIGTTNISGNLLGWRYANFFPHERRDRSYLIDDLIIKLGTSQGNFPAQEVNDENTLAFYTFNNTLLDNTENFLLEFNSNLNSTVAITANGGVTQGAEAELNAQFTQTTDTNRVTQFDSDLTAQFAQAVETGFIQDANSALNATFSQIAICEAIRRSATSLNAVFTQNAISTAVFGADTGLSSEFNLNSEITRIKQLEASFEAFYTQLSAISKVGDFFVNADVVATQSAVATAIRTYDAAFASTANQNVLADRTRETAVVLSASFAFTVDVNEIVQLAAELNTQFTQTATAEITRDNSVTLNVNFDIETDAAGGFIGLTPTDLNSEFNQTVTALRIKQLDSQINSAFDVTAVGDRAVGFEADLNSTFNQTVETSRTRPFTADFEAFYSQLSAVNKIGDFFVNADVTATIDVNAVVFGEGEIPLDLVTNQTVSGDRIRGFDSNLNTTATQTVDAIKAVEAGATLSTQGGFAIDVIATKVGDIDLEGEFNQTATAEKISGNSAALNSEFDQFTNTGVIKQFDVDLGALFSPSINAGINRVGAVDLDTEFTLTVNARIIQTDAIVYVIPTESRTYAIEHEIRIHRIHRENRAYTIQGDE